MPPGRAARRASSSTLDARLPEQVEARRLLRRQRGADERRQALARQRGPGGRRLRRRPRWSSRSPTTGSAAPTHGRRLGAARAGRPRRGARRHADRVAARRGAARRCGRSCRAGSRSPTTRVLLREGLARLLDGGRLRGRRARRRRRRAARAGRAHQPGRRDRRHPHAADAHRRGPARRQGDPRALAADRHPRAVPARQRALRGRAARRPAPTASATCSRSASPTSTSCPSSVRRVGEGGSVLDPAVVGQLVGRPRARPTTRSRSSPTASARCSR